MSIKLASIREDASESVWLSAFAAVLQEYEHPHSSTETPDNEDIVVAFDLINTKLNAFEQGGDDKLVCLLLDSLRVLLRFRENVGTTLTLKLMRTLLKFCSFEDLNVAAQLAARCLINLLFDNPHNVEMFLSVEVDGIAKVAHILERYCAEAHLIVDTEEADYLHHHLVRALHMIVCQNESAREELRPVDKPHPLTYSLVRALIQRLHLCVAPNKEFQPSRAPFPHSEIVGKLFIEIARLLCVLDWHVVLHVHSSVVHSGTSYSAGVDSNGAHSVLSRQMTVTIISAIVRSSVPYPALGTTAPGQPLLSLGDQCQDVSVQLAMFLPIECYSDHAVLTELSALVHGPGSPGAASTTAYPAALEGQDESSAVATIHIDTMTRISLHLVSVLHRQLQQAHNEYPAADTGAYSDNCRVMKPVEQCALLSPVLMVLTNLCTHNTTALNAVKSAVFPHAYLPLSSAADSNNQAKMDPTDVPPGTLRYYLIKLMISLDSQLKRCVAEFLFVLCAEDADEFTARTGFGNAVALLQLKGLC
eukprot:gene19394-22046_t